jgi:hypothetical protein
MTLNLTNRFVKASVYKEKIPLFLQMPLDTPCSLSTSSELPVCFIVEETAL